MAVSPTQVFDRLSDLAMSPEVAAIDPGFGAWFSRNALAIKRMVLARLAATGTGPKGQNEYVMVTRGPGAISPGERYLRGLPPNQAWDDLTFRVLYRWWGARHEAERSDPMKLQRELTPEQRHQALLTLRPWLDDYLGPWGPYSDKVVGWDSMDPVAGAVRHVYRWLQARDLDENEQRAIVEQARVAAATERLAEVAKILDRHDLRPDFPISPITSPIVAEGRADRQVQDAARAGNAYFRRTNKGWTLTVKGTNDLGRLRTALEVLAVPFTEERKGDVEWVFRIPNYQQWWRYNAGWRGLVAKEAGTATETKASLSPLQHEREAAAAKDQERVSLAWAGQQLRKFKPGGPPATLTASALNKELDKLDALHSTLNKHFIASGRGHETPESLRDKQDALATFSRVLAHRYTALQREIELRYGPRAPARLPMKRGFGPRERVDKAPKAPKAPRHAPEAAAVQQVSDARVRAMARSVQQDAQSAHRQAQADVQRLEAFRASAKQLADATLPAEATTLLEVRRDLTAAAAQGGREGALAGGLVLARLIKTSPVHPVTRNQVWDALDKLLGPYFTADIDDGRAWLARQKLPPNRRRPMEEPSPMSIAMVPLADYLDEQGGSDWDQPATIGQIRAVAQFLNSPLMAPYVHAAQQAVARTWHMRASRARAAGREPMEPLSALLTQYGVAPAADLPMFPNRNPRRW